MAKRFPINDAMRKQLIAAFVATGISSSAAFVAWDLTLPAEGVFDPYLDPVGLPTVCVGHMDRGLDMAKKYTLEECMKLFAGDWEEHQRVLDSKMKGKWKSDWQHWASTDFTFNKGGRLLGTSTFLKDLNAGNHAKACTELTKWVFATDPKTGKKVKLPGLEARATKQYKYCMGELPYDKLQAYEAFKQEYDAALEEYRKNEAGKR